MQLHIILGPTSVGKTAHSIALAKQTKAPVIVLDRIQIYQELATGSGRPAVEELEGTTRVYLEKRRIADGELSAQEAFSKTIRLLEVLFLKHKLLILEGGSISLCQYLFKSGILYNYQTTIQYLSVGNEVSYYRCLWNRMHNALVSRLGQRSLVEELDRVWRQQHELAFVRTILGYNILADWCEQFGQPPCQTWNTIQEDDSLYAQLTDQMFSAYLKYSQHQQQVFQKLISEYQQKQRQKDENTFVLHNRLHKIQLK
jgi:adenylate kinase family enzyme